MTPRRFAAACAVLAVMVPTPLLAQGGGTFGVGPRFSFVRSQVTPRPTSDRYSGAMLRARISPKTAIELAIDYRSHINESLTERIRDYPLQGSWLVYPMDTPVAPYILLGIGSYKQKVDTLKNDSVVATVSTRKVGYHAGAGGEVRLGHRASVFVDYRYTFIRFGPPPDGSPSAPGAIPLPGPASSFQRRLKLSHQGSMWTTGVTFFF